MENNYFHRTFNYTGNSQKITLEPGTYSFECWGAQGYPGNGGKGAYTKGIISLPRRRNFYIFVGQRGLYATAEYAFNGGGYSQTSGGGASDIRLSNGKWDDFLSLKSRIMVAAGGGGPDSGEKGGAGGCLNGIGTAHSNGGTQTEGGYSKVGKGSFGKGGMYADISGTGCGGGGGGYYGGSSSTVSGDYAGAGGSSFISGFPGCNATSEDSNEDNIVPTKSPNHYSGLVFRSPVMIDGNSLMPSPTSSADETGHSLDGYVRIAMMSFNHIGCTKTRARVINYIVSIFVMISMK